MKSFNTYLNKVFNETQQIKRISIEIRGWTPKQDGEYEIVVRQVEGDTAQEFFQDYERKFGIAMDTYLKQGFIKLFNAAVERSKIDGNNNAEVDAMIMPKGMSKEQGEQITGRNQTLQ